MSKRRIPAPDLGPCDFIKVYYDSDLYEYSVTMKGNREATYFTNDKADALSTAQAMRNEYLRHHAELAEITARKEETAPARISECCRTGYLKKIEGIKPDFINTPGCNAVWNIDEEWPLGAGLDAPDKLPAGSCYILDPTHINVVMPTTATR